MIVFLYLPISIINQIYMLHVGFNPFEQYYLSVNLPPPPIPDWSLDTNICDILFVAVQLPTLYAQAHEEEEKNNRIYLLII